MLLPANRKSCRLRFEHSDMRQNIPTQKWETLEEFEVVHEQPQKVCHYTIACHGTMLGCT